MKIKTWIKYEESYLPPRCRKLRYTEKEDYVDINLKEVDESELKLAFEVKKEVKIYLYNKKLWCKAGRNTAIAKEYGTKSALEDLIWINEHCSTYFYFADDREKYGADTSRKAVINRARKNMKKYILVGQDLYEQTKEPAYEITTFGLGHNHGGTGLFCTYGKDADFSALDSEKAVLYANAVARERGDTDDIGKFRPFIVCHIPEIVKKKSNNDPRTLQMIKKEKIKELWEEFGAVPMNPETECIEEDWNRFPAGTFREDIWHWFEETYDVSVAKLMYEED